MELLGGGAGLLSKGWCGRWWRGASERHYSLRLPQGQVVASPAPGAAQVRLSDFCHFTFKQIFLCLCFLGQEELSDKVH